jgi:hypothetical protein
VDKTVMVESLSGIRAEKIVEANDATIKKGGA